MKFFLDRELAGHAMVFNGPLDLLRQVAKVGHLIPKNYKQWCSIKKNWKYIHYWLNPSGGFKAASRQHLKINSWKDYEKILENPWPEATSEVRELVTQIRESGLLPEPAQIKRKRRMKEDGDELDIDYALRGEKEFYIGTTRNAIKGPRSVAIITNLDAGGGSMPSGVFKRSASALAVSEILETAGYSVEIWAWCLGYGVYAKPNSNQFSCTCVKEAGKPMDLDALVDSLSVWITRQIIFASFACSEESFPVSIGGMDSHLGEWEKYMQVSEGVLRLYQPIYGDPLKHAIDMLTKVDKAQRGLLVDSAGANDNADWSEANAS